MIANFKKKQKSNSTDSFFSSPFIKIFFLIIIIFLVFADIKVYKDRKKLNLRIDNLKERIQEIKDKNNILEQGIAKSDDKDYIEKIAREELDLQTKDEKVVSFIMPKDQQKEEVSPDSGFLNFKNWLGWLSNSWQWLISSNK